MASPEEYTDAAVATLRANLQPALNQQMARWAASDAAAERDVRTIAKLMKAPRPEDYYPGGVGTIRRWPSLEVASPDLTLQRFAVEQYDADGLLQLMVRASLKNARGFDPLYRAVNRWGSAIAAVLAHPDAFTVLDDRPTIQQLRAAYRWNPEANEHEEIKSGVLLVFWLQTGFARP